MKTKIWDSDSDVESVTTVDGNVKVNTDPAWLGEDALWGDNYGSVLDTVHWDEKNLNGPLPDIDYSVSKVSGKLHVAVESTVIAGYGVESILTFPGDFDRQVDIDDFNFVSGYLNARLHMHYDNDNWFAMIRRRYAAGVNYLMGYSKVAGAVTLTTFNTTVTSFKLRLVRAGTNLKMYYDVGGGWVLLHEYTGATSIGTLKLWCMLRTDAAGKGDCDFNNLIANSGFPVWDDSPELVGDPIIPAGTDVTCDMSAFAISTTGTGNIKHKYKQSGAWSGTWLTEAEMQALGEIETSQFKHQFNSNGQQAIKINSVEIEYRLGDFDLISQGLGQSSPLLEGGLIH